MSGGEGRRMERHHAHFQAEFTVDESSPWNTLMAEDFASIFGLPVPPAAVEEIRARDLRHRFLSTEERDRQILKVLRVLDEPPVVSGPGRQEAWERGWSENLAEYSRPPHAESALLPHYYRRGRSVMRLRGDYVLPRTGHFEADFLAVLHPIIASAFFSKVPAIHEFGCGPGHNLLAFSRLVPGRQFHGYDWAVASSRILALADRVAQKGGNRFSGHVLDMFNPDPEMRMEEGSAAFTFGSMEQLGHRHGPFLGHLLAQPASIYVHIEPFSEFRDPDRLLDVLADRYARRRGYLDGYLLELERLEREGEIEIMNRARILGSAFYDGWCMVTWRKRSP